MGAQAVSAVPGGVAFQGGWDICYGSNLWSRLASRILWRVATFAYGSEEDLYARAREVDWPRLFNVACTLRVNVSAQKSPLKSLDFATLRIKDAVCDRFSRRDRRSPRCGPCQSRCAGACVPGSGAGRALPGYVRGALVQARLALGSGGGAAAREPRRRHHPAVRLAAGRAAPRPDVRRRDAAGGSRRHGARPSAGREPQFRFPEAPHVRRRPLGTAAPGRLPRPVAGRELAAVRQRQRSARAEGGAPDAGRRRRGALGDAGAGRCAGTHQRPRPLA